jgi:hypothetical protein
VQESILKRISLMGNLSSGRASHHHVTYLVFVPEASLLPEGSFLLVVQSASASILLPTAKVRAICIGDAGDWLKNNK